MKQKTELQQAQQNEETYAEKKAKKDALYKEIERLNLEKEQIKINQQILLILILRHILLKKNSYQRD